MDSEVGDSGALVRSAEVFETASRDLGALVASLRQLADAAALRELALGSRTEISAAAVRTVIAARGLRAEYLDVPLGEPGWAIMLEAFAARLEGRRISISDVAAAARLRSTTAYDWVRSLIDRGLLVRLDDPEDGRSVAIGLTDDGAERMCAYLAAAFRLSPWVA